MGFKKLRIAWSIGWGIICLLSIGLWVRNGIIGGLVSGLLVMLAIVFGAFAVFLQVLRDKMPPPAPCIETRTFRMPPVSAQLWLFVFAIVWITVYGPVATIELISLAIFAEVAAYLILRKRAAWQFSLSEVLTVMTGAAIVLAVLMAISRE